MGHRPVRGRCAALAARVRGFSRAAECVLLRASQDRARGPVRVSQPSWPLSTPTLRAAHGYVRLAACGVRGEERGRNTRAIGWAPRGHFFFMLVHSHLGTPLGSGSDLGRFGHV